MQGSTPDRRISFFPLKSDVMALAVSPDDSAALRMQEPASEGTPEMPGAPMWMSVPANLLQSGDLPEHARPFAHSMERAESVMISFVPDRQHLAAKLDVRCRNGQDAAELASQLSRATELLRQMLEREHQKPDPAGFSGILTAGTFHSEGSRVYGYWPIEPAFLDALFAGS
ncbi:MAG: hypothetical protein JO336_08915 [Acidobacteriia bacterium]|nr:hypothetical protein [Terriglobia bacterium]